MLGIEKKLNEINTYLGTYQGEILDLSKFFDEAELLKLAKKDLLILLSLITYSNVKFVNFPSTDNQQLSQPVNISFLRKNYNQSFQKVYSTVSEMIPSLNILHNEHHLLLVYPFQNNFTIIQEPADMTINLLKSQENYKISNRIYIPLNNVVNKKSKKANSILDKIKEKNILLFKKAFFAPTSPETTTMEFDNKLCLASSEHKEVFLPFTLSNSHNFNFHNHILYASTWPNTNCKINYNLQHFVTAMCLFGYALQGIDERNQFHPLLDPDYNFDNIKIRDITALLDWHPYEQSMHSNIEKLFIFINNHVKEPVFHIHLPYTDYLLKATLLFVKNVIDWHSFVKFLCLLTERCVNHIEVINDIARKYTISLYFNSPLDSLIEEEKEILFSIFKRKDQVGENSTTYLENIETSINEVALQILNKLGFPTESYTKNKKMPFNPQKLEEMLVTTCFNNLKESSLGAKLTWAILNQLSPILTISDLLGANNVAMISQVKYHFNTEKKHTINVCAVHTLEEKPIQQKYNEKLSLYFGEVFPMLILSSILFHAGGEMSNLLFRLPYLTQELTEKLKELENQQNNPIYLNGHSKLKKIDHQSINIAPTSEDFSSIKPESNSKDTIETFTTNFYDTLTETFSPTISFFNKISVKEKNGLTQHTTFNKNVKYSIRDCLSTLFEKTNDSSKKDENLSIVNTITINSITYQ